MAKELEKRGPKFTPLEREQVMAEVARLDRCGYTQWEIAQEVGVTQPQVHQYIKEYKERYKDRQLQDYAILVEEKRQQFRDIRREAWKAYFKSMEDIERVTEYLEPDTRAEEEALKNRPKIVHKAHKKGKGKKYSERDIAQLENSLVVLKRITMREGRLPASEFLNLIRQTLIDECKLLGLMKDDGTKKPSEIVGFDWDSLVGRAIGEDPIEGRINDVIEGQSRQLENRNGDS